MNETAVPEIAGAEARSQAGTRAFLAAEAGAGAEMLRFAASAAVVTLVAGGLAYVSVRGSHEETPASEADTAIVVTLPAAEAAPRASSEADDGPPQPAQAAASAPEVAAPEPPKPAETPPTPRPVVEPTDLPPPPVAPDPAAALEPKKEEAPPPPPPVAVAPPSPAQEERAPEGSSSSRDAVGVDTEDAKPHASRHAVTAWQRSLMRSIEAAKKRVHFPSHSVATVAVAFVIDERGRLASERVTTSSGSPALDTIALALIREAAPFEPPPKGADAKDASFVVPVRFR